MCVYQSAFGQCFYSCVGLIYSNSFLESNSLISPMFTGYQAAYCQLAFAGSTDHDPFSKTIPDAKVYLAQCLNKLSTTHPGKVNYAFLFDW